jgi:RNA polymerase sigma-70 factor (ECF subfamily)
MGDLDALHVIDERSNTEQELETQRELEALGTVVAALPPQCRRVLIMRKIFGFTHREIARHMDISVRTVEKHLAKALQRCQAHGRQDTEQPAHRGAACNLKTASHDD